MTVHSTSGACDPTIASCPVETVEQRPSVGVEAVALSYSDHVKANVVRTGDGFRDLFSMCKSRAIENVGVHFAPPVALACIGGGMFTGLAEGAISLPGRVWDTGRRFASNTADGIGSALADIPFFAVEFAGYGQMGAPFMAGSKTLVPPPAEAAVFSGMRISGNAGGSAASIALVGQPAVAVASVDGAVGIGTGGIVVAANDSFGGPIRTNEPMRMGGDKSYVLQKAALLARIKRLKKLLLERKGGGWRSTMGRIAGFVEGNSSDLGRLSGLADHLVDAARGNLGLKEVEAFLDSHWSSSAGERLKSRLPNGSFESPFGRQGRIAREAVEEGADLSDPHEFKDFTRQAGVDAAADARRGVDDFVRRAPRKKK